MQDPALLSVIKLQIAAAKSVLASTHATLVALEAMLEVNVDETPEVPAARRPASGDSSNDVEGPVPLGTVLPGECPHPPDRRQEARTMGHPNRFICKECGETVN